MTDMFIDDDFLLESDIARKLYHEHAEKMPIIDYHNHLSPKMIAENAGFSTITELWLGGDHYKWRLMRANGVDEKYITGDGDDYVKFEKWADTLQYAMRNPLYHWSHLELKRYFGVDRLLDKKSAREIYGICNEKLKTLRVRDLLKMMNVKVLCTTDDPVDSLEYHRQIAAENFEIKVLPAWRPDKVVNIQKPDFKAYIQRLSEVSGKDVNCLDELVAALYSRAEFFKSCGCKVSDHGLTVVPDEDYTEAEVDRIFKAALQGRPLTRVEVDRYQSALLYILARINKEMDWVQQFHVGAIRDNNRNLYRSLGPDIGCDSIADGDNASGLSRLFGKLGLEDRLAKTILYNLNPKDSGMLATMAYNFNDGTSVGKMQYGAAWWFLDQYDGIMKQLETLSSLGLLSRFIGMLTDSRSFISFTRHEYFRRILCNLFATDINRGFLPASEIDFIGKIIEDISYNNAKNYFEF